MKFLFTFLLLISSVFSFSQIRISQVYGGGGNPGATYTNDFVEIFNAGPTGVDISNWSIQYASATGPVAPGDWAVAGIPASTNIAAGKYFLIALASGGPVGVALPTADLINTTINISNTSGKIALVNNSTPLNGTTACTDASVVDLLGYGTTATCSESAAALTNGIDNTLAQSRAAGGCTDTNNNSVDFSVNAAAPKNSLSPSDICGPPSPLLTASPANLTIFSSIGIVSTAQSYTLSGSGLGGFPGNITVSASPGLEISFSSGAGFASSLNVPYTSETLANTSIYVRIASSAAQGIVNGTVTNSGGGAAGNAVVTISGGVYQNYYNTAANNILNELNTWSTTPDGLGANPADFTSPFQAFNIVNQANTGYSGSWNVTGAGNSSRVIVGDGSAAITLTIPAGPDSITSPTRVDVLNNATLLIQNNRRPFLNNLATGSTVDFAQPGMSSSDTIRIPNISFYNLKLTGGLKYFSPGVTTIRGDLIANNVISINGSSPSFTTVNALGDVDFINSQFEQASTGADARITLAMNGSGTQAIRGNQIYLFRLQRDSTSSNSVINLTGDMFLGNDSGGGLRLNQGSGTSTVLDLRYFPAGGRLYLIRSGVITSSANGKINADGQLITISKTSGNTNAGTLRFVSGALINLLVNFDPAFAKDSIMIADSVNVESLTLVKGRVVIDPAAVLTVTDGPLFSGGQITGGSPSAFVDGKLRRAGLQSVDINFPLGKADKYAPISLNNVLFSDLTAEYFFNDFGNHTIDPAILATYVGYNVSYNEFWNLRQNALITPDPQITFYYTDSRSGVLNPPFLRMANFAGTQWEDVPGGSAATNTTASGYFTLTATSYGPYTFSAYAAGVLPVRLTSFQAQKVDKSVKLTWTTSQEINSSHFIVQRSADGTNWADIDRINAAGNSISELSYSFVDYSPSKGINYYRLKQYDINNNIDYSLIKNVFFSTGFEVTVNPNPAKDFINIYISKNNSSAADIFLTDMNGRTLQHFTTSNLIIQVPTTGMNKGMYLLKVIDGQNTCVNKVLVY